jgi:uncharacterized protein (DUF608 family)
MKFNEWITQKQDFNSEDDLLENQLDQWVTKLMGLLQTVPEERKQKFLEKVINNIQNFKD